jgi:hypothetical protein
VPLAGLAIVDEPDIRAGAAMGIGGSSFKKQRDEALVQDASARAQVWIEDFLLRCQQAGVSARAVESTPGPSPPSWKRCQPSI